MIDHLVLNAVLGALWYTTYKILQSGDQIFHAGFTVFGPFGIPVYRYLFQVAPQYNFSRREWIIYALYYWDLLLLTRDFVEFVTLKSAFLDDALTLLRITLAVFWFSMFRNGLTGSIHNIWNLTIRLVSCICFALLRAYRDILACGRWMTGWLTTLREMTKEYSEAELNSVGEPNSGGEPPIDGDNNNTQLKDSAVRLSGGIPKILAYMQIVLPCISLLLALFGFDGTLIYTGPLTIWLVSMIWGQAIYDIFQNNNWWRWMTNRPILTSMGLLISLLTLAVIICEQTQFNYRHWFMSGLFPAVYQLRGIIVPLIAIAVVHNSDRLIGILPIIRNAYAGFVDRVYAGGRRAASVFSGAHNLEIQLYKAVDAFVLASFIIGSLWTMYSLLLSSTTNFNPYKVLGFPTGFRFTNVDLRQAYRKVGRPWVAGGEVDFMDHFEQGTDAYQILANPNTTCKYLAKHDTPFWRVPQANRQCEEDPVAVVGPAAEMAATEVDFWVDEEIVREVIHLGQTCYDEDGHLVLCGYYLSSDFLEVSI